MGPIAKAALALVVIAIVGLPTLARAGVTGELGWSADGLSYGICEPWTLPDSTDGCRFFSRPSRVWITIGRREALGEWRNWESPLEPTLLEPIIPVYPMSEREDDPGPVTLNGRLMSSDDVVELWTLAGDVTHGDRGGEWVTVFDYSPDGSWLAAGAVHVDHETSLNEVFVTVRPVAEWLALAHNEIAISEMARGHIRTGLEHIARARELLDSEEGWDPQLSEPRATGSPVGEHWVDDDPTHSKTFVRWSTDAKTLCVCDGWSDITGESKARCHVTHPGQPQWTPVLVSLVQTHCPGYGKPPAHPVTPVPVHVATDGGYDAKTASVTVYMTGGPLGDDLGAVMEKSWPEPVSRSDGYPGWFHSVAVPSPDGKWLAAGYLMESGPGGESLHHEIVVDKIDSWIEIARSEASLYERTEPVTLDDATPPMALPGNDTSEPDPPPGDTVATQSPTGGCSR